MTSVEVVVMAALVAVDSTYHSIDRGFIFQTAVHSSVPKTGQSSIGDLNCKAIII